MYTSNNSGSGMLAVLFFIVLSFHLNAQTLVAAGDHRIRYSGRVLMPGKAAQLSWPASSASIRFQGTGLKAILQDQHGMNFIDVLIDGKLNAVIHPDSIRKEYTLAARLPAGNHRLELFKRTEWTMGWLRLYALRLDSGSKLLPAPPAKKRRIEFFGNSITCGYAVLDTTGLDRGTAPYEDAYQSYACITARYFDADLHMTARSGIGLLVSWFPMVMPEMYDRLNPADPSSKWDFSSYQPQVVVVNLFQNDAWLTHMPENEQFKFRFGSRGPDAGQIITAYRHFIEALRRHYPNATLICALGSMDAVRKDAPWPGYIRQAVSPLKDPNILVHIFPYKHTPGHPSRKEQEGMANDLIAFIAEHVKW